MIGIRLFELQRLRHRCGSGLLHGVTDRWLDTLQIGLAGGFAVAENESARRFSKINQRVGKMKD